jgi:hypothetical protein
MAATTPMRYSDADELHPHRRSSRVAAVPLISHPSRPRRHHPSERYFSDPILCEYVWKDQRDRANSTKDEQTQAAEKTTFAACRREYCLDHVRACFIDCMDASCGLESRIHPWDTSVRSWKDSNGRLWKPRPFENKQQLPPTPTQSWSRLDGESGIKDVAPPTRKRKYGEPLSSPKCVATKS